ncbi:MAG: hypothetical protein ACLUEQ_01980 [Cloacibacillus evryensis]
MTTIEFDNDRDIDDAAPTCATRSISLWRPSHGAETPTVSSLTSAIFVVQIAVTATLPIRRGHYVDKILKTKLRVKTASAR